MKGITISEMKLGDSASFTKTVSEHDVYTYAGVSGDFNPAHVNEVEAQKGMFGKRIAHGMLSAGFISTVLGTQLPGPGTIYMGQELRSSPRRTALSWTLSAPTRTARSL